jgi:hypothetical protein
MTNNNRNRDISEISCPNQEAKTEEEIKSDALNVKAMNITRLNALLTSRNRTKKKVLLVPTLMKGNQETK